MKRVFVKRAWVSVILCSAIILIGAQTPVWAFDQYITGPQLTNDELDQLRGGYSGFFFGVSFTGYFNNLGNVSGSLLLDGGKSDLPVSPELPPPTSEMAQLNGDGVRIQAYVGKFEGASGIFQIVQSPGSYNVIQNNMVINFTIINVADKKALPALINFMPWK